MSGSNIPQGWKIHIKHSFIAGPSGLKNILMGTQNLLKFSMQNNFKYIRLGGALTNPEELEYFLENDWSHIDDIDHRELFCIPEISIPEIKPLTQGYINKGISRIGAFITNRYEIVFIIALHVTKGVLPYKALTLIPELESNAKKALTQTAQAQGDMQLVKFLQEKATFAQYTENMVFSSRPISCDNFFASLEKPILNSQEMQESPHQELISPLFLDPYAAAPVSYFQAPLHSPRISSPFITGFSDSPYFAAMQQSPAIIAKQLDLQDQFEQLSESPSQLPQEIINYSPQMARDLAHSSSSAAQANLATFNNPSTFATSAQHPSLQNAIDTLIKEQEALKKQQDTLIKQQQEQQKQYETTLLTLEELKKHEMQKIIVDKLNFGEINPPLPFYNVRTTTSSDKEAAAAATTQPEATKFAFSQYKKRANDDAHQERRSPRLAIKRFKSGKE